MSKPVMVMPFQCFVKVHNLFGNNSATTIKRPFFYYYYTQSISRYDRYNHSGRSESKSTENDMPNTKTTMIVENNNSSKILFKNSRTRSRGRSKSAIDSNTDTDTNIDTNTKNNTVLSDTIPTLKEFMHRKTVISQYRNFIRIIHRIPDTSSRAFAMSELRLGYDMYKRSNDKLAISMAMKEANKKLKELQSIIGGGPTSMNISNNNYTSQYTTSSSSDSWLDIKDDDDPRGRMGVGWPWQETQPQGSSSSTSLPQKRN